MADFTGTYIAATDYGHPILGENSAHGGFGFAISSAPGVAEIVYYLMRGRVAGADVYWYATTVDVAGAEYTGGGLLSNVRLVKRRQ